MAMSQFCHIWLCLTLCIVILTIGVCLRKSILPCTGTCAQDLSIVVYKSKYCDGGIPGEVQRAVQALSDDVNCDVTVDRSGALQPVTSASGLTRVDVIFWWDKYDQDINSIVQQYHLNRETVGQRNLVLMHVPSHANTAQARHVLGDHTHLFYRQAQDSDCIISWYYQQDIQTSVDRLGKCLLSVALKENTGNLGNGPRDWGLPWLRTRDGVYMYFWEPETVNFPTIPPEPRTHIHKCSEGTHDCHEKADCTDTDDGYTCTCTRGYVGDGTTVCTELSIVVYKSNWDDDYGTPGEVQRAVQALGDDANCDVTVERTWALQPVTSTSGLTRVDIIFWWDKYDGDITSLAQKYHFGVEEIGMRNLLLLHVPGQPDTAATRRALGGHTQLFQCIISWFYQEDIQSVVDILRECLLSVVRGTGNSGLRIHTL